MRERNTYQKIIKNDASSNQKENKKHNENNIWLFGQKFKPIWPMERQMVENVLWIGLSRVRFAAEGSLLMNWKIVLLTKEELITHASRPEGLAN